MAQSILHLLSQIRGGAALVKANDRLSELVAAVKSTGQPGEITLTITVKPDKTDETIVKLVPKIKAKIPERAFAEGLFFVSDNGELSREDPRQIELDLERKTKLEEAGATALNQVGRGPGVF